MEAIGTAVGVISLLCSCSKGCKDLCNTFKLKKHKEALESAIEELKDARDDVQRRVEREEADPNEPVKRTSQVNGWLQRVQTVELEMGDILQKTDLHTRKCLGCGCPKNCWSAYKHGKSMIQMLELVKDLNSKANFATLTDKLPVPSVQEIPVGSTVGMESMLEKAWRLLMGSEGTDVRIMGLYGTGGVGKTTLLKQINNEFLKLQPQVFDVVIFVVVSKALNIEAIQKEIGERLSLPSPNKASIFNVLKKKKFVLLLDDLWERIDLQGDIGVPPPDSNSKVVFTTRSETVCGLMEANKNMKVDCLPWDQAWNLFQEKVGEAALKCHSEIPDLAKVVAKECGGLPLVLITIGRAMSTKKTPEQWNHAITILRKSPHKFPGIGDKVLPLLMLSYDDLHGDTIRSCFLYCSLFPEDFSIGTERLAKLWFVEGFFSESDNLDEALDQGYEVVGSLLDAGLLEKGQYGLPDVKMHDVIRDLALWITTDFGRNTDKFLVVDQVGGGTSNDYSRWKNAKRVYWKGNAYPDPEDAPKFPNLLTLISSSNISSQLNFLLQYSPLLRVLNLSGSQMIEFPSSITELAELQYLNLSMSHITELPDELRKLVKLKWLDLSHTRSLKKIPSGVIGSLVELKVLNMVRSFKDWDYDEESDQEEDGQRMTPLASIAEVGALKHLNHLDVTINNSLALEILSSTINPPRMFQSCTKVDLTIENVKDDKSLTLSSLYRRIMGLKSLRVSACKDIEELRFMGGERLIDQEGGRRAKELSIHSLVNLKRVVVETAARDEQQQTHEHYGIVCSSSSSYSVLDSLTHISISNCHLLRELTWLVYVKNLEYLNVSHCYKIEEIIADDNDDDGVSKQWINSNSVFERLRELHLDVLPTFKSICRHPLAMPSLERIIVIRCEKLRKSPLNLDSNPNGTLKVIMGSRNWWDELQWEDISLQYKFYPYFDSIDESLLQ